MKVKVLCEELLKFSRSAITDVIHMHEIRRTVNLDASLKSSAFVVGRSAHTNRRRAARYGHLSVASH